MMVYLVEVSKLSNLVPEVLHDGLVLAVSLSAELTTAFNQGVPQSQALEVVLVEVAIVVDVCWGRRWKEVECGGGVGGGVGHLL